MKNDPSTTEGDVGTALSKGAADGESWSFSTSWGTVIIPFVLVPGYSRDHWVHTAVLSGTIALAAAAGAASLAWGFRRCRAKAARRLGREGRLPCREEVVLRDGDGHRDDVRDDERDLRDKATCRTELSSPGVSGSSSTGNSGGPALFSLRFDLSPEALLKETQALIMEERALADHIASLYSYIRSGSALLEAPLDFENTFQLMADMEAKHAGRRSAVTFPGYVSPDVAIRESSVEAQKMIAKHDIELGTRVDVYRVFKAIAEEYEEQLAESLRKQKLLLKDVSKIEKRSSRKNAPRKNSGAGSNTIWLTDAEDERMRDEFDRHTVAATQAASQCGLTLEHVRFIRHTIRDYERLGMQLGEPERVRFVDLRTRISNLCIEFQKNLNDEDTHLWFSHEQLAGMPETFLAGLAQRRHAHRPEETEYELSLKYPHYFPVMKHCSVEETRRLIERQFNSRCVPENVRLLEEAVQLRDEAAKLLGYPSHAAYVLDTRMAGTPQVVTKFLERISKRMERAAQSEIQELRRLKRRERRERNGNFPDLDGSEPIQMWDLRYYMAL